MKKALIILIILITLTASINAVSTDNIISYYKLDENAVNTFVLDSTGRNNGTASTNTNNLFNSSGKINSAFDFTRANSEYINVGNSFTFSNEVTLNAWINQRSSTGNHDIISKYDGSADGFIIYTTTDDDIVFVYFISGVVKQVVWNYGSAIESAGWLHLVGTFDGIDGKLYVNGVLRTTVNSPGTLTISSDNINIGRRILSANYVDGLVDEVGIWNESLNQSEVTQLYNDGDGLAYPFAPVDTCSCPGLNQDWEINMSDFCVIQDDCDLGTGTLSFTGSGNVTINSSVDTTNLGDPGANGILYVADSCILTID